MNPNFVEFHVPNWGKYNATHKPIYPWFKLAVDFFDDEKIWALPISGKLLYVYCLCLRSAGKRFLFWEVAAATLQVKLEVCKEQMALLFDCGLLSQFEVTASKVLEEKRREENTACTFDLEAIYQSYPRKLNNRKQFGMNRLARDVKTPEDYDKLVTAVRKYRSHVADVKEERFIKQFATWAGEWREWISISPRQPDLITDDSWIDK